MAFRKFSQSFFSGVLVVVLLGGSLIASSAAYSSDSLEEKHAFSAQQFKQYVNRVRETFNVPGIAVAIVKDGEVVLEEGYGVRNIETEKPVTAHTLFAIASNTKAMTAAALSILADRGKLEMTDRVIDHLPWFRMSDPYVTQEMRIRDLLAHRSGLALGAGDLLYWPTTDYTTREVVQRLRYVPIKNSFRSNYAYDNILFGVATLVIEEVSGKSYAQFLNDEIFDPVGMDETRINYLALKPSDDNVATGYAPENFDGALQEAVKLAWANNSGAGGTYSSVHDMAQWMMVQLAGGKLGVDDGIDNKGEPVRLFSEERHDAMWTMLTPIPVSEPDVPELAAAQPNFLGYGQGWYLSDYRGYKVVSHTGGWPGFVSSVTLVPELDLGVVVLTNQQSGAAFKSIYRQVMDIYMDAPQKDWVAAYVADVAHDRAEADDSWEEHVAARDEDAEPSQPLSEYAGMYEDPWYGKVAIAMEDDELVMRFTHTPDLVGDMEPWQNETFIVRWREDSFSADAFATFSLSPDGEITGLRMKAISPRTDFSFDFHHLRLKPVDDEGEEK